VTETQEISLFMLSPGGAVVGTVPVQFLHPLGIYFRCPVEQARINPFKGVLVRRRHRTGNQVTSPWAKKKTLREKNPMTSRRKCAIHFSTASG
jgi:hypothetical protein